MPTKRAGLMTTACRKRRLLHLLIAGAFCLSQPPAVQAAGEIARARQVLPAGNERVIAELDERRNVLQSTDPLSFATWEARRLHLNERTPISGVPVAVMQPFEKQVVALLQAANVPGACIAIAYKGKLVYARGFGYADLCAHTSMPPDALFRLASVSKALTAVGTLRLCDEHKTSLDARPIPKLGLHFGKQEHIDEHLNEITVKQLLQCTGGWDREISGDPMFVPLIREAINSYSNTLRPTRDAVLLYGLRKNLDFLPGTHFAYSNFGYAVLGKYIEQLTGKPYEQYMKDEVLAPIGITDARLGKTMELAAGETCYYPFAGQERAISVFPNVKGRVPLPYGGDFGLEAMQADTGWIASTIDMVKFFCALAGDGASKPLLSPAMFSEMTGRPDVPEWKNKHLYFSMGLEVNNANGKDRLEISREGSLAGCITYVAHQPDGYCYAFAVNSRPAESMPFQNRLIQLIRTAISTPNIAWGKDDQFAVYR